jgi:hypothetical protein
VVTAPPFFFGATQSPAPAIDCGNPAKIDPIQACFLKRARRIRQYAKSASKDVKGARHKRKKAWGAEKRQPQEGEEPQQVIASASRRQGARARRSSSAARIDVSDGIPNMRHLSDRYLGTVVGTSGWTYDSWRGPFYPQEVPKRNWLD